jgi:outer membrane protein
MSRTKYALLAFLALPLACLATAPAFAQYKSSSKYGTSGVQAPSLRGQSAPQNLPPGELAVPGVNVNSLAATHFESNPVLSLPDIFGHQWTPGRELAPEELISERYLKTQDSMARRLSLKETIYIAIRNNPAVAAVILNPIAATESVKLANAAFDPDLTSQLDVQKDVAPVSSAFQVRGSDAYTQKLYDWNFGVNKVSALTNGTLGISFDNNRTLTNSTFASVNPSYTPNLTMSLEQPLLRNFGWDFATINVRLSESAQRSSQWTYGSSLNDFVERVGNDYWGLVAAEENLEVAKSAFKFNADLVRVNRISVQVGTLAPIDLQEAQSAASTAEANVYAAEAALKTGQEALRQDAMLNPAGTFLPEGIEPSDQPNPVLDINDTEETALEKMVEYSPSLGGLRESIRTALLQVKYQENQMLPQVNLGAQFGVTSTAGTTPCVSLNPTVAGTGNCTVANVPPAPGNGSKLPFGGIYGDALNHMLDARFYNYAAVLNFEMPLDNAAAKAALAQARVSYEESRMQYRSALSESVLAVESALANYHADIKRAQATRDAVFYAEQSLRDEQVRFRVGLATTHDLLQFQSELVTAQGNQVSADTDLENSRIALWHSEGTLMPEFNIDFEVQDPHVSAWYARF